ncbi:MAG: class II fructose-bisphosphate aldolase, partial [Bacilli bacterium]|nr:class II fructose-bisphosphate aldolase [Bacilli bacterium]
RAIACGTAKINVNTECQLAFARELRKFLANEENNKVYDPRKIIGPATIGIVNAVREKIIVFGSKDKAEK